MTEDLDLVRKRLAFIATCVQELRTLARPAQLDRDVRERRFVEHTLQLAIQAALDVASHIVATRRLAEPSSNRELFATLHRASILDDDLCARLVAMAGFRNILVHGYTSVDVAIVQDVLAHRLGDLDDFIVAIRDELEL
jgi:uncharacterized protein YutE (UPF0331/DUF86 family)